MIRKIGPDEIDYCVSLYKMAMENELKVMFNNSNTADKYLHLLCAGANNSFSKDYTYVEEDEKKNIRGMICLLPGSKQPQLENNIMTLYSWRIIKTIGLIRYIKSTVTTFKMFSPVSKLKIHKNELYINAVAVFPDFRGQKVSSSLLKHACELAEELKLDKVSLLVRANNNAFHVYQKYGFETVGSAMLHKRYKKYGLEAYIKMEKMI